LAIAVVLIAAGRRIGLLPLGLGLGVEITVEFLAYYDSL
jgi:hypothetical protein